MVCFINHGCFWRLSRCLRFPLLLPYARTIASPAWSTCPTYTLRRRTTTIDNRDGIVRQDNVPRCLWWLKDASMIKQAFEALCVNELQGLEFDCDTKSRYVQCATTRNGGNCRTTVACFGWSAFWG